MAVPKFVQRVARIPELLALASTYPDGVSLGDLAARFGTDPATLREDLTTYLDLESWGWSFQIFRRSRVELVQPGGGDGDREADVVVRVVTDDPSGLGVEHLSAGDLAVIYTAGTALLDVERDDDLAAALGVIARTMYGEEIAAPRVPDRHQFLAPLEQARAERRRVRLLYSRAWRDGVIERDVEPLRLVQTHRGWELDAGPVGPEGNLRTYLLAQVRDVTPLDDTFEPPSHLDARLAEQRATTRVRLELAQEARWAADVYAEHVTVVSEDDESFVADLDLLPPVGERVGLLMLAGGPTTRVVQPGSVLPDAVALVEELIAHHDRPLD